MKLLARVAYRALPVLLALSAAAPVSAQDSKSGPLAKQLAAALDAAKMDSIAAKDPEAPDAFAAALYFPGMQLLVVSGKYSVPQLLVTRIANKEYRDVYLDLSSASVPETKIFIEDAGANGLKAKRDENRPYDTYEAAGKRTMFNSDWKAQNISEDVYNGTFAKADERYSAMLQALLDQVKKP